MCEAVCNCRSHMFLSTERRGWLEPWKHFSLPFCSALPSPLTESHCVGSRKKEKKGGLFLAPLRTTRWYKSTAVTPNSSGEVQASGGCTNTGFSLWFSQGSIMSWAQLLAVYFTAQLIPHICAFHPHVFYCLLWGRKSLTFEATHTFSALWLSRCLLLLPCRQSSDQPLQTHPFVSPSISASWAF